MNIQIRLSIATTVLAIGIGCSQPPAGAAANTPTKKPATNNSSASKAQPKLPTIKLWVGRHEIISEIADSETERQKGMMFRTNMGSMEGMLFVFQRVGQQAFWMRNTTVSLDVAYIDPDGKIREIYPLEPLNENTVPSKSFQIQYVLEMNQGWFEKNEVKPGMIIRTEKGSFRDTFFRRR
ncbi:MAG: hypothetical protein CMO80_01650 [Verrucomicrobiales bacterium]|nr:hypothetical protein [Verrucomicrobiales bacterium]|tara:strand:- start:1635 stop:2174 length:540 start_codon:yes stop_codon:yes gene_type:complete